MEDDEGLRSAYRMVLAARGFDVGLAGSGEEALERLARRSDPYAAIVADLGLPGLSGVDLVARLREAGPQSPIIVLTGTSDEWVRGRCLSAGAAGYLVKPVTGGELEAALREVTG